MPSFKKFYKENRKKAIQSQKNDEVNELSVEMKKIVPKMM